MDTSTRSQTSGLQSQSGTCESEGFAAAPGSANNGESKWAWMMKWCKKNGLAPATATVWKLAEKRWLEANSLHRSVRPRKLNAEKSFEIVKINPCANTAMTYLECVEGMNSKT